ncbi:hypothetical protein [Pseudolactococcus insecticola]|uniref:Uncharacterized protein n=1 Tax=Pseudolactococcus insecticola TaxID=2709158 RepID=A0A6A0B8M8_9LACT|nr:hypothetical protein [Lactococcus insecticola]GFH40818.1 hypothetical protein Hs20B_12160 [Lactococcus insecticola]
MSSKQNKSHKRKRIKSKMIIGGAYLVLLSSIVIVTVIHSREPTHLEADKVSKVTSSDSSGRTIKLEAEKETSKKVSEDSQEKSGTAKSKEVKEADKSSVSSDVADTTTFTSSTKEQMAHNINQSITQKESKKAQATQVKAEAKQKEVSEFLNSPATTTAQNQKNTSSVKEARKKLKDAGVDDSKYSYPDIIDLITKANEAGKDLTDYAKTNLK